MLSLICCNRVALVGFAADNGMRVDAGVPQLESHEQPRTHAVSRQGKNEGHWKKIT